MNLGQATPGAGYPNVIGSGGMAQPLQPAGSLPSGGLMAGLPPSQQQQSLPFGGGLQQSHQDAAGTAAAPLISPQAPPMVSLGASSAPREPSPGRAMQQQPGQLQQQPSPQQQALGGARIDSLAQKLSAKARPASNTNQMPPTHAANDALVATNASLTDTVAGVNAVGHQLNTPQPQPLPSPVQPTSAEQPDLGRQSRSQNRQQQQQVPQQQKTSPAGGRRRGQQQQQQQQPVATTTPAAPAAYTPNRPRSDARFKYEKGEHVYAMYMGGRWYRCVILDRDVDPHPENPSIMAPNYLIKYLSNARGMADLSEWVLEECILPLTDEARVRELNKWAGQEGKQTVKTSAASSSASSSSGGGAQRGRKRPAAGGGRSAARGPPASKKAATGGGRGAGVGPVANATGGIGSGQAIRTGAPAAAAGRGRGGAVQQPQPPQLQQSPVIQSALAQPIAPPTADVEMKDVQGQPAVGNSGSAGGSEPTRPERVGAPVPSTTAVAGGVVSHQHPGSLQQNAQQQQHAGGQFVPNGGNAVSSSLSSTTTSGEPSSNQPNDAASSDLAQASLPQKMPGSANETAAAGQTATTTMPATAQVDAS